MVDEVILKTQVTSYFLEKEHHGDHQGHHRCVKKRVSKEYRSLGLGLGDPLAGSASLRSPLVSSGPSD